jgi:transcriptional regulator with XRE-family HTH domain
MAEVSGQELVKRIDGLLKEKGHKGRNILYREGITKKATISNWFAGKAPSAYTLYEIARFLGVSLDYLLTGESPPGLSPESMKVARAAERLSPEGRAVALNQIESLVTLFPLEGSISLNKTI